SVTNGTILTNTANAGNSTADPNTNNNSAAVQTTVRSQADLQVQESGPSTAAAGTNVTYTITVTNSGPNAAVNGALNDPLPSGETFVSQTQTSGPSFTLSNSGNAINDTITSLAVGSTATFTVTALISASTPNGTVLVNTPVVSSPTYDPNSANNSAAL